MFVFVSYLPILGRYVYPNRMRCKIAGICTRVASEYGFDISV